ncbi:MAG: lactoylglutathione lyase [Flavobacteriales bacterium]|mgnify:CR=1 FL=1|jgi:catechol 2,3-dioxygenase-like lactoylglutathione lyase family enzyme|nr:lactoylglutathione lyase [Flavobacteriales bacterium]MBK6893944.1 lactoylglutathione lyase [Flavobacteriales bacterium]MBK7247888.1 lactoylglutathione lyase [Flavobacteriales bacterium]MBK9060268.1 lactoylglutathione lyase [Flavobacteriales bacterium]MBK9598952.1 lactoylglutathione lyase [Flavobacteriales bacterium]
MQVEFILYVADQAASRDFYRALLAKEPALDVPGMTGFDLGGCRLGLMPTAGIAKIITPVLPHPDTAHAVPRCELYLPVIGLDKAMERGLAAGAVLVSPPADRDWGHRVGYLADRDGHVVALAEAGSE